MDDENVKTSFGKTSKLGGLAGCMLCIGCVAWASIVEINGAVIALGSVAVAGKSKLVQHLDGGIVDDIKVKDGSYVEQGEILVTLDRSLLAANLEIYRGRLAEAIARKDRLKSEQASEGQVNFSNLPRILMDFEAEEFQVGQSEVFKARKELQDGREIQIKEKITQFGNQKNGVNGLLESKRKQLGFIEEELLASETLQEKGLTVKSQMLSIQRSQADLEGQISEHTSELARIENSVQDAKIEMLLGRRQFKEQVVSELREVSTQIGELTQQILSTEKQLERVELKAPVAGIVHELQVYTKGGVVPPGGTVMQIVPQSDGLIFEVQIDPNSIDQIYIRQDARVRFSAFNQRTTPELLGAVSLIAPSSVQDQETGLYFYRTQIEIPLDELKKLHGVELVPGMPVEAYLQTDERTVMSYLLKPLSDQVAKAFREE